MQNAVVIIGYSGHAHVVCEALLASGYSIVGYCEPDAKENNPYDLPYLGSETSAEARRALHHAAYFCGVGDNKRREQIHANLFELTGKKPVVAVHPTGIVAKTARFEAGVFIGAGAIVQANAVVHEGGIVNSGAIVEHDCVVGAYAHVGPRAVLCGNVSVGDRTFVGAAAVALPGIRIANDAVVGAGSVVLRDVAEHQTVVGNPARSVRG